MTFPTMMTREELLELAALDSFGLLDDYESDLYTRSLHHAPAAVQTEVLTFQAQLASDDTLLPQEDPSPALRQRVLAVVARAIERQNSEFAPIATIGRRRSDAVGQASGRWFSGTSQLWRAAAFLLTGMVVVLAYFAAEGRRENQNFADAWRLDNTSDRLKELVGKTFDDFLFDAGAEHYVLADLNNPSSDLKAVVYFNEGSSEFFLVTSGLPSSEASEYQLEVKDASGNFSKVFEFAGSGGFQGFRQSLATLAVAAPMQWRITGLNGSIVLASA